MSIIYVNQQASSGGNGISWTGAYQKLESALATAQAGDEIWVARGTYTPGSERSDTFSIDRSVSIYGGFVGDESSLDERNWQENLTILSGELGEAGRSYHVVSADVEAGAVIDGVIIQDGDTRGAAGGSDDGAGIYNRQALTLRNSIVRDNVSADDGGGIRNDGELTIINSSITDNTAIGTSATSGGGGLLNTVGADAKIINSTFSGNSAPNGGAIRNDYGLTLTNVTISGNTASNSGGGIFSVNGSRRFISTVEVALHNTTITNNTAEDLLQTGFGGGGIANVQGILTASNSIIAGNTNDDDIASGGGDISEGHNLIGNGGNVPGFVDGQNGDRVGTKESPLDAGLNSLGLNGGFTATHSPKRDSVAVDSGRNDGIVADSFDINGDRNTTESIPFDQRGADFTRIVNATVDIGAVELAAETVKSDSGLSVTEEQLIAIGPTDLPTKNTQLKLSVNQTTNEVYEIVAATTDEAGRINGIAPGEDGYTEALIAESWSVLSTLEAETFDELDVTRQLTVAGGSYLQFGLIEEGTLDSLRQGGRGNIQIATDLDSATGVLEATATDEGLALGFDVDGDRTFDDVLLSATLSSDGPTLGAGLQGGQESELIDLREIEGPVSAEFSVYREASFDNVIGFFAIENEMGQVLGLDDETLISPGEAGYVKAAIARRISTELTGENGKVTTYSAQLEGGQLLSSFIVSDGAIADLTDTDTNNDPAIYFTHLGANSDGADHVRLLGDNIFGFEDMAGGGDQDFDDVVVKIALN